MPTPKPPVRIPEGYYQATLKWSGPNLGSAPRTVLGLAMDPTVGGFDIYDIHNALVAAVTPPVNEAYEITNISWRIGSAAAPYAMFETAATPPGTGTTGAPSSPQCAMLITKNSLTPGRQGRGRMYLPGPDEGAVDSAGNVDGGLLALLFQVGVDLVDMGSLPGFTGHVILHPEGSPLAETPTFISQFTQQNRTATQRRRLR